MKKLKRMINWILNLLLIVFFIIVIYLILERVFGNSPTDFQLILWISGFFGTAILKIFNLIYDINRETGELKTNVKNGFDRIKIDIRLINNKLDNLIN